MFILGFLLVTIKQKRCSLILWEESQIQLHMSQFVFLFCFLIAPSITKNIFWGERYRKCFYRYCKWLIIPPNYPAVPLLALQENSKANEKQNQHWKNNQVLTIFILLWFPFFLHLSDNWYIPLPMARGAVGGTNMSRLGWDNAYAASAQSMKPKAPAPLSKTAFLHAHSLRWYLKPLWGCATVGLLPPSDPNWTQLCVRFKMQPTP